MRTVDLKKPGEPTDENLIGLVVDRFGDETHCFKVYTLESFNSSRRDEYLSGNVIDGEVICHKDWFMYDELFEAKYEDCDEKPMEITWDNRFYVVVKSFDGQGYAVNVNPYYYSDLVAKDKQIVNKSGNPKQLIIPVSQLSDDYVFALTDSYILERFSECSNWVIEKRDPLYNYRNAPGVYKIDNRYLEALRFMSFFYGLKQKYDGNIVVSFSGNSNVKRAFYSYLTRVCEFSEDDLNFRFTGHYYDDITNSIPICRPVIAKQYQKNGYLLLDFFDIVCGKYVNYSLEDLIMEGSKSSSSRVKK